MKKTFCYVCSVIICMSMLVMTSCKNTGAVKEAAEKAIQAGAIKLGPVGEATAMTVDDEALVCEITADTLFMNDANIDKSLVARYMAIELLRTNPDLFNLVLDNELGLKGNLKLKSGENVDVQVGAEDLRAFNTQVAGASGNFATILLPIYNQYLNGQGAKEIGEGLTLKKVQVKGTQEQFMVDVDEKVNFDDLKRNLYAVKDDAEKKIDLVKEYVGMALPLIAQMNYSMVFRYANKAGNETFLETTPEEINAYLNK